MKAHLLHTWLSRRLRFILLVDLSQGGGGVPGIQENVPGTFLWIKLINESSLRCMDNEVTSPRSSGVSSSDKASTEDKVRPLFCVTSILAT